MDTETKIIVAITICISAVIIGLTAYNITIDVMAIKAGLHQAQCLGSEHIIWTK